MTRFGYTTAIFQRYPHLVAGVVLATGLHNGATPADLDALLRAEEARVARELRTDSLSTLPSIAAWRAGYSGFGIKPSQYRSSVEALLRRVVQVGSLPRIGALVDACNCVALRRALPVAVFDLDRVDGDLVVGFALGTERYAPLGEGGAEETPSPGEVVYHDAAGVAHSRRWNWRQSARSRVRAGTRRALITTEALHAGGREAVEAAMRDLADLVPRVCGGVVETEVLDAGHPMTAA